MLHAFSKITLLTLSAFLLISAGGGGDKMYHVDNKEEQAAFQLLNKIRKNPAQFSKVYGVNLDTVKPALQLKWNDTLAKVAEARALDMAKRGYFDHVNPDGYAVNYFMNKAGYKLDKDWLTSKSANYFESLDAGSGTGVAAIENLIVDNGWPAANHRVALLSMSAFDKGNVDIGIGFVKCE